MVQVSMTAVQSPERVEDVLRGVVVAVPDHVADLGELGRLGLRPASVSRRR